jgi:hypothetical protein
MERDAAELPSAGNGMPGVSHAQAPGAYSQTRTSPSIQDVGLPLTEGAGLAAVRGCICPHVSPCAEGALEAFAEGAPESPMDSAPEAPAAGLTLMLQRPADKTVSPKLR